MKYFRCFIVLTLLLWSPSAMAGDLTLFGGFQHPGGITLGSTLGTTAGGAGQLLTDPRDFGVFGARLYRSNAPFGFEHTLAYSPNFVDSRASAFIYNSNLRVELPLIGATPYGTLGLGIVRASGDGPAAFGTKFSLNYGGGVKMSMFGPLGARFDVRGYSIRSVEDQTLNVVEASVGLVFSF